jgi:hypothetical protein
VQPGHFLPDPSDPSFRSLSQFVISRALHDWHRFLDEYGHIELAINLSASYLQVAGSIEQLAGQIPNHPPSKAPLSKWTQLTSR